MDYPVSAPGVNLLNGKFTDGNPAGGVPASLDPSEWANLVTDEMLNVVTAAGVTPSETTNNQLAVAIQSGLLNYGIDTGVANAYVVAYDPVVQNLQAGTRFTFKATNTNTAGCTLNVGTGPLPLNGMNGAALVGSEILAGALTTVECIGASFVLINSIGGAQQLGAGSYGATPAQFDNSPKLATTAFLQRAGFQYSGIPLLNASRSLLESDLGGMILCQTAALTLTLPTPQSLYGLLVNGPGITFSIHTTQNLTITAGAGVTMDQESGVSAASVTLLAGSTITFYASSSTSWTAIGGSGALAGSSMFAYSKGSSGYQVLPTGIIVQWGAFTTSTSGYTSCPFPLAFPNGCLSVVATPYNSGSSPASLMVNTPSKTGFNVAVVNGSSAYVAFNTTFVAIGD